jgi:hypothetical protein
MKWLPHRERGLEYKVAKKEDIPVQDKEAVANHRK